MVMVKFFAVPRRRLGVVDVPTGYATFGMPEMLGLRGFSLLFIMVPS